MKAIRSRDDELILKLNRKIRELQKERREYKATFALQQKRLDAATKAWRDVTGEYGTIPDLGRLLDWLLKQIKELKAWKTEAMATTPDWQECGELLGLPLGDSIHDKIIPALRELKQLKSEKEAREEAARVHTTED